MPYPWNIWTDHLKAIGMKRRGPRMMALRKWLDNLDMSYTIYDLEMTGKGHVNIFYHVTGSQLGC